MITAVFYGDIRRSLIPFYDIIHIPAEYICNFWVRLGLPPHGDAAIVIVPPIALGLQWLFILVVVFFITRKRHQRGKTSYNEK